MTCRRVCLLALVATLANADTNRFLAKDNYADAEEQFYYDTSSEPEVTESNQYQSIDEAAGKNAGDANPEAQLYNPPSLQELPRIQKPATSWLMQAQDFLHERAEAFFQLENATTVVGDRVVAGKWIDAQEEAKAEVAQRVVPGANDAYSGAALDDKSVQNVKASSDTPTSFVQVQSESVDPESDMALYGKPLVAQKRFEGEAFIQMQQAVDGRLSRHLNAALDDSSIRFPVNAVERTPGKLAREAQAFFKNARIEARTIQSDRMESGNQLNAPGTTNYKRIQQRLQKETETFLQSAKTEARTMSQLKKQESGNDVDTRPLPEWPSFRDMFPFTDAFIQLQSVQNDDSVSNSFVQAQSDYVDPESDVALYGGQAEMQADEKAASFIQVQKLDNKSSESVSPTSVSPNSFVQLQSDFIDPESDVALYGQTVQTAHGIARVSQNQAPEKISQDVESFIQMPHQDETPTSAQEQSDYVGPESDLASLKVEGEAFVQLESDTKSSSLLHAQTDYMDPESDMALFGKQDQGKLDGAVALVKTQSGTTGNRQLLHAGANSPLLAALLQLQSATTHARNELKAVSSTPPLDDKTVQNADLASVAPNTFLQWQSDSVDPESDVAQFGGQDQGNVPGEADGNLGEAHLASESVNSVEAKENTLANLPGTEESQSDAASMGAEQTPSVSVASDDTREENAGYTNAEAAMDQGPGASGTSLLVAPGKLEEESLVQLQQDAIPSVQSELNPESDLALYGEAYQNGSFDL